VRLCVFVYTLTLSLQNGQEPEPNQTLTAIEPEQNRTQTIRVLSHLTPHHTNGQRNATLVNTKTSQSTPFISQCERLLLISGKQRRLKIIVLVQNALWACRLPSFVHCGFQDR